VKTFLFTVLRGFDGFGFLGFSVRALLPFQIVPGFGVSFFFFFFAVWIGAREGLLRLFAFLRI
jgi:hypothetical protein